MEGPSYHAEITAIDPDRQQTLSIDIMLRQYKNGVQQVVSLSVWNEPDDYDPSAVIDFRPADARAIAEQLRNAADVLGGPQKAEPGQEYGPEDDDEIRAALAALKVLDDLEEEGEERVA